MTARRELRCVVCAYDLAPTEIVKRLGVIAAREGLRVHGIIVDNRRRVSALMPEGWCVLDGSNTLMDFSAYAEGTRKMLPALSARESVLILNDSVFSKHHAGNHFGTLLPYTQRIDAMPCPAIAGRVDRYVDQCYANPWSGLPVYVASFAFLANAPALERLLDCYDSVDAVMGPAGAIDTEAWGAGLTLPFREFLRTHVTMPRAASAWYQAARWQSNPDVLERKARCVYLEHRLSGEVGRDGVIFSIYASPRATLRAVVADQWGKVSRRLGQH